MRLTRRASLAAALLPLGGLAPTAAAADGVLKIIVTFSVLADFVGRIGGARVQVTSLVAPDQDLHGFEPRPSDAKAIAAADVFIANGLGIDDAALRLARAVKTKRPAVIATRDITPRTMIEGTERVTDPHAWHDAANARRYVGVIADALAAADPSHGSDYRTEADAYLTELGTLDASIHATFAAIPRAQRRAVTTHDALGYFGAAYGIDFVAPLGLSTDGEPSAKALAALIGQIKRDHIRALFLENVGRDVLLQTVSRETGVRIGGQLFSDALSPPAGVAGTYVAMMRYNSERLAEALR